MTGKYLKFQLALHLYAGICQCKLKQYSTLFQQLHKYVLFNTGNVQAMQWYFVHYVDLTDSSKGYF